MIQYLPKISVVTPVLNRVNFVERAVRSVMNQKYQNFEHIIIDGASTDGTLEILKKFPHVRLISEPDDGPLFATNKGLKLVTGDMVTFLNADDFYLLNAFETIVRYFQLHPEWQSLCGRHYFVNGDGKIIGQQRRQPKNFQQLRLGIGGLSTNSLYFRREVLEKTGVFDTTLDFMADFDFAIRLAQNGQFQHIPEYLSSFCMHGGSGQIQNPDKMDHEVKMILHRYSDGSLRDRFFLIPFALLLRKVYMLSRWRQFLRKTHI